MLRRILPVNHAENCRRVLIYGAGDGGELIYRELRNNPELNAIPVAFVDDDPAKNGRLIHGLRVYSTTIPLEQTCQRLGIQQVLISTSKLSYDRLTEIVGRCAAMGLLVSRAGISFEPLQPSDFGWVLATDGTPAALPGVPLVAPRANLIHPSRPAATDH
jgi:UDP-GlcNAc:undecaprenyl-phosphate GlcNAc-1-phosphate transferase